MQKWLPHRWLNSKSTMKKLNPGPIEMQWDNKLIRQLGFIKKHLRYPFNKTTMAPGLLLILLTTIAFRFGGASFVLHGKRPDIAILFILALMLIPVIVSVSRYLQTLRFVSVPTPFFSERNSELIQAFLTSMQLAVYRHPDAPEVFRIVSKNIDAFKDQREVMVFIADDKRILLNSHYTRTGFTFIASSGNYRQMAKRLKKWLDANIQNTNTGISHNNYF